MHHPCCCRRLARGRRRMRRCRRRRRRRRRWMPARTRSGIAFCPHRVAIVIGIVPACRPWVAALTPRQRRPPSRFRPRSQTALPTGFRPRRCARSSGALFFGRSTAPTQSMDFAWTKIITSDALVPLRCGSRLPRPAFPNSLGSRPAGAPMLFPTWHNFRLPCQARDQLALADFGILIPCPPAYRYAYICIRTYTCT